jgi:hypothetical protein
MAKKERIELDKKDWTSRFTLVGEANVNDFTFKMNQTSDKSDWVWNQINLRVDCGEKHGKVDCELMNGYGSERDNVIYVHGKKEDGTDDFSNSYTIAWEDRFDEDILKDIGSLCFIRVGLEKTDKDKTFYKDFLTGYDAIEYMNEHLTDGTVIKVDGQLRYSVYNGSIQCRKEITSLVLSQATPDKYRATFIQTMLLDEDSCTKESLDKDASVLLVDAYLLEKFKEYNGWDLTENGKNKGGQFVPLRKRFEFDVDLTTDIGKKKIQAVLSSDKMFKVKKGTVTQITFEGEFVESGAAVQATLDDVPDDIKELIEIGVFTEEEALAKCSDNGSRERRMLILKPHTKKVGDEDSKTTVLVLTPEKYSSEDLIFDFLSPKEEDEDEVPFVEEDTVEDTVDTDDGDDWLNSL